MRAKADRLGMASAAVVETAQVPAADFGALPEPEPPEPEPADPEPLDPEPADGLAAGGEAVGAPPDELAELPASDVDFEPESVEPDDPVSPEVAGLLSADVFSAGSLASVEPARLSVR
jgi:hypothetical protein